MSKRAATLELPEFLQPFVPELNRYVPRQISKGMTDSDFFDHVWHSNQFEGYCAHNGVLIDSNGLCHKTPGVDKHDGKCVFVKHSKMNLALTGPTGTGKTSGLVNFAARHNLPMFTVTPATTPHAAFGQFVPDPDTSGLRWVKGPAWMIAIYGGILYFDEINFLDPSVQSVFFALTDFRRSLILTDHPVKAVCDEHGMLESLDDDVLDIDHRKCAGLRRWEGPLTIPLHPRTLICATYNPVGQYAGTQMMNAALSNRFTTIDYGYDNDIERQLLHCASIAALGAALRSQPDKVRTPTSTNRLIEFERLIQETGDYSLSKKLFLDNYTPTEQLTVKQLLENYYEVSNIEPDGGIFGFFGLTAEEDEATDEIAG